MQPDVPFSSQTNISLLSKGICNQCLSVDQAAIHLVRLMLPVLVRSKLRGRHRSCRVHPFHPFPQSGQDCSSVRLLLFFFSFLWFFKIMRRREGLIKESRGCDYQTLKVSPVHHWAFPSPSGPQWRRHWGFHRPGLSCRGVTRSSGREGRAVSCWKQLRSLLAHHRLFIREEHS